MQIRNFILSFFAFCLLFFSFKVEAYSVLTHQAIIDAAWSKSIVPVLEKRFPGATTQEFIDAHAYAYGGAIMPDMGYYPMGSVFFTDLVHYVRTGEFTINLLNEAKTRNELAFALGALAHYYGDTHGHAMATNVSVPLLYPKAFDKFGNEVTYEEDPVSHMRMEFGFDVLQAARGNYAPQVYRDFIGFKVAREVLERAFLKTYGIKLRETFVYLPLAERIFRISVKALLPEITKIGWNTHQSEMDEKAAVHTDRKIAKRLRKASFKKQFGKKADKPGVTAQLFSLAFRLVPKFGMLQPLKFKLPNAEAEKLFADSFEATSRSFEQALNKLELPHKQLELPDLDFDTGNVSRLQEYKLADDAYTKLLHKLADHDFEHASASLKKETQKYFAGLPPPPDYRKEKKEYRKTTRDLARLNKAIKNTSSD